MRILITAGPTREFIDPVRFLSNRSTGKMGYAVARMAAMRGHSVRLVSGPVSLATPEGVSRVNVTSALDLLEAIRDGIAECDALVMCAAVADWRPSTVASSKLKKHSMKASIELVPNPDILQTIRPLKENRVFIGFAAETDSLIANAAAKLEAKGLDMIVANDVSKSDSGFESDTNRVVFITPGATPEALPLMSKDKVADAIVEWIEKKLPSGCRH